MSKSIAELLVETTARLSCVVERNTTYEGVVRNCFQDISTSAEMARKIVARVYGPPCEEPVWRCPMKSRPQFTLLHKLDRKQLGRTCDRCGWPVSAHAEVKP